MIDKTLLKECPFYRTGEVCAYLPFNSKCEGDCNWTTYKELEEQLADKNEECERLNEELYYWVNGDYCDSECNVAKELNQLKAELTMLQELKDEDSLRVASLATELNDTEARLGVVVDEYINLCNIINEIEEIIQKARCSDTPTISPDDLEKILNKIKEMN